MDSSKNNLCLSHTIFHLLKYEIDISFTNKPTNLKFYADSNRTQELVLENDTYLALNGFLQTDDDGALKLLNFSKKFMYNFFKYSC